MPPSRKNDEVDGADGSDNEDDGHEEDAESEVDEKDLDEQYAVREPLLSLEPLVMDCDCCPLPWALLRVCRTVHAETEAMLYGENSFRVIRTSNVSLRRLMHLSDGALTAIRELDIHLTRYWCPIHGNCRTCRYCREPWREGHGELQPRCSALQEAHTDEVCARKLGCIYCRNAYPINTEQPRGRAVLEQWRQVCRRLTQVQQPGRLSIKFECDCVGVADAARFAVILQSLPPVAQASIRFGRSPGAKSLVDLARETGQRMICRSTPGPTFPKFLEFPRELQLRVVQLTDFRWSRCLNVENRTQDWYRPRRCHQSCCPTTSASWSSTCKCEQYLTPLSLVSQQMRSDALETLFESSCVVLHVGSPLPGKCPLVGQQTGLESLPVGIHPHIRHVKIVFHHSGSCSERFKNGKDLEWVRVVDELRGSLTIDKLRLDLQINIFWHFHPLKEDHSGSEADRRSSFRAGWNMLLELYRLPDLHQLTLDIGDFRELEALTETALLGPNYICPDQRLRKARRMRQKPAFDPMMAIIEPEREGMGYWDVPKEWLLPELKRLLATNPSPWIRQAFSAYLEEDGAGPSEMHEHFE